MWVPSVFPGQQTLPHGLNQAEVIVTVMALMMGVGEDENSERDLFTAKHPKYLINLLFIWQTLPSLKVPCSALRFMTKQKRLWEEKQQNGKNVGSGTN